MLKRILAGLIVAVVITSGAVAGPFEDGKAAYDHRDFATALRLWRPLAEKGHAAAQLWLGFLYLVGQGVPHDYAEAAIWLRKAADQGNASAEVRLTGISGRRKGVRDVPRPAQ